MKAAGAVARRRGLRLRHFFKKQGWTIFAALSRSPCLTLPFGGRPKASAVRPERYPQRMSEKPRFARGRAQHRFAAAGAGACKGSFLMTVRRPQARAARLVQRRASRAGQTEPEGSAWLRIEVQVL